MRPTRWTRQKRATKYGKGGWSVRSYGFSYTHPVTGNGCGAGWNLRELLATRRLVEVNHGLPPHLHVTRLVDQRAWWHAAKRRNHVHMADRPDRRA